MHAPDQCLAHTRILVVEDEPVCRNAVKAFLESAKAQILPVATAEEAIKCMATESFDAIVTDIRLGAMDGIELLKRIRGEGNDIPVIVMTGFASMQSAISALQCGADDYLIKPITNPDSIIRATRNAIDRFHLRTQNAMLRGQLKESELSYQTVFDHTADMIFSFPIAEDGEPGAMETTNLPASDTLGYKDTTLRKMTLLDVIGLAHRQDMRKHLAGLSSNGKELFDTMLITADGKHIPCEMSCHMLQSPGRNMVLVLARDISDRVEIEARFANMLEEERFHMGRELHDAVCQDLASIEIIGKLSDDDSRETAAMKSAASSALAAARQLSQGLLPSFEDGCELRDAVETLLQRQQDHHGIKCDMTFDDSATTIESHGLLHLFRIIQEATNNTVKHGDAKNIDVELKKTGELFQLTISDDGTGLESPKVAGNGMGALIMRQRARILGASLSISGNDNGTIVECNWQNGVKQNA